MRAKIYDDLMGSPHGVVRLNVCAHLCAGISPHLRRDSPGLADVVAAYCADGVQVVRVEREEDRSVIVARWPHKPVSTPQCVATLLCDG